MKNNSNITLKAAIFWAASASLVLTLIVFTLEKSNVIDFYSKPMPDSAQKSDAAAETINEVNYSPATDQEVDEGQIIKEDAAKNDSSEPAKTLSITLSAASQDDAGGPVIVRTIIGGATGGSCALELTKGSIIKTYSATITSQGTYYACNTDIPYADLTNGVWRLKLTATQGSASGTATEQITVRGT